MYTNHLKIIVGVFLIVSHFGAMVLVAIGLHNRLETGELIEVILILSPIFSLYTMAIVKDFAANRELRSRGKKLNGIFVFMSIFFVAIFSAAIILIVIGFRNQTIETEADLRKALSAVEVVIGVYLGIIVDTLFRSQQSGSRDDRAAAVETASS